MGRLYAFRWLLPWLLPFLISAAAWAEGPSHYRTRSSSEEGSGSALAVSPTSLQLSVGQHATVKVSNAVGTVRVSVASTKVATASVFGTSVTVTARSVGSTTLSIYDSRKTAVKVSVTVTKSGTTAALAVSPTTLSIAPGQSASVAVSNVSGTLLFSVANTGIATATLSGSTLTVTGKSAGTTTVSVVDSRNSPAKVTVTVVGSVPVPVLSASPMAVSLTPGQTAKVSILNASGTISVKVANTAIATATLSGSTLTVTGKNAGTTQVTVSDSKYSITIGVTVTSTPPTSASAYTLLAWNDLGMHCMDGKDYSVFSILPPYNNLHAQLINTATNKLVTSGVTLTYESLADPTTGSINTISSTKTNFWQYVQKLFGLNPAPDVGLTGNKVTSLTPSQMVYNATENWFEVTAIPMTPYDDSMNTNYYPMVKVVARDSAGNVLAQARVVLPVSDEMSCASCHAPSSTNTAAMPKAGWITDPNPEIAWKKNILQLHDEKQAQDATYQAALKTSNYSSSGLLATVLSGTPVLCASCHSSNALGTAGAAGVEPLTQAVHSHHASVIDPATGTKMDSVTNRNSCYQCHPGSQTKCLRGAMGSAVDANGNQLMQCQSCHGGMSNVGKAGRVGWLDEPNCQSCHHDDTRETSAVDSSGALKVWTDATFATNANAPQAPYSLYRFSAGHGGLQCEACHGPTHAVYPTSTVNDNILANDVQGHTGTIAECTACHQTVPTTNNGGPHGMHTVGQAWVKSHESYAKSNKTTCAYCHGADYRGSALSELKVSRTFSVENGTKSFAAGHQMNCYDCHNGPNGG